MPAWLLDLVLNWVVPFAVGILKTYGIPALEQKFPALIPLINEVLALLNGNSPTSALTSAGDHFNSLVSVKKP